MLPLMNDCEWHYELKEKLQKLVGVVVVNQP